MNYHNTKYCIYVYICLFFFYYIVLGRTPFFHLDLMKKNIYKVGYIYVIVIVIILLNVEFFKHSFEIIFI